MEPELYGRYDDKWTRLTRPPQRRKAQNRFAQRAYRQRKEQAYRELEQENEELKLHLAKEKKLNQVLGKVIEFLKERLKTNSTKESSSSQ